MNRRVPALAESMIQTMRWFGPQDTVSLSDIRQAGCEEVVTALHHIPNGVVWPRKEIAKRRRMIEGSGMKWTVVESVPVPECIKTRSKGCERAIDHYQKTIRHLSQEGIKVVTYNFMPVLDWTRTDLAYLAKDGSLALRFEKLAYVAFDLKILKRKGAKLEYSRETIDAANLRFQAMSEKEKRVLKRNIISGLPGSEESFTLRKFRQVLESYREIGHKELRENLKNFLLQVAPVAEECGIGLALHPDDPPFSIFGLPRIVCNAADLEWIAQIYPGTSNGFCICTGSLGVSKENDIPKIIRDFSERVHFFHLRNVSRNEKGDFFEDNHLEGDVNMYWVIREISALGVRRKCRIPMRPDHGHQMLDDMKKKGNPGYSAIGRLRGLAELRGLEFGVLASLSGTS